MGLFTTAVPAPGDSRFRGRDQELTLLRYTCQDAAVPYAVVYGGRQNGKTSLLLYLLAMLQPPIRACLVDFGTIPAATPERMFVFLAEQIAAVAPPGFQADAITDASKLREHLHALLERPEIERLVVILDHLAALSPTAQAILAATLRSFLDDRTALPPLGKFQAILSGGIELYEMVFSKTAPLYTRCAFRYVSDLPPLPAIALITDNLRAAGVDYALSAALGRAVYNQMLLGHAYLTKKMGELLIAYHAAGAALDGAAVERAAAAIIGEMPPFLQRIRADLQHHQLDQVVEALLRDPDRATGNIEALCQLELIGLVKHVAGHWFLRNRLLSEWTYMRLNIPMPALLKPPVQLEVRQEDRPPALLHDRTLQNSGAAPEVSAPAQLHQIRHPLPPTLVKVPASSFLMGSNADDPLADRDEQPQHTLTLPDFWIGEYPITNAQFQPFVEGDGYANPAYWTAVGWQWREQKKIVAPAFWHDPRWRGDDDCPVVGVTWVEAVAYCRWLGAQFGTNVRLPTEAEWEKAARGPDGRIWPWGNSWEDGRCNSKESAMRRVVPVGYVPGDISPYGVRDMAGNVHEWSTAQRHTPYPYAIRNEWKRESLESDAMRVIRGGSWTDGRKASRVAYRSAFFPRNPQNIALGLRVVCDTPP